MREDLEKRLGELWGCIVIKYEIFKDKLKFQLRLNENDQYSYFEVIFEGVKSVFYVYEPAIFGNESEIQCCFLG